MDSVATTQDRNRKKHHGFCSTSTRCPQVLLSRWNFMALAILKILKKTSPRGYFFFLIFSRVFWMFAAFSKPRNFVWMSSPWRWTFASPKSAPWPSTALPLCDLRRGAQTGLQTGGFRSLGGAFMYFFTLFYLLSSMFVKKNFLPLQFELTKIFGKALNHQAVVSKEAPWENFWISSGA